MAQLPKRLPAVAAASVTTAFLLAFPSVALADDGTSSGSDTTGGDTSGGISETTGTTEGAGSTTPTTASDPFGEAIGSLIKTVFGDGRTGAPTQHPVGTGRAATGAQLAAPAPADPAAPATSG